MHYMTFSAVWCPTLVSLANESKHLFKEAGTSGIFIEKQMLFVSNCGYFVFFVYVGIRCLLTFASIVQH